jgi:trigger factor
VKVSVEKLPTSEAVLEVDFTWEELEKASEKAYRKLVQKVDVQGFRRGKAPRSLLERRLGKEYIYQEGLDELITETYRNAIKEHELVPITKPDLDAPEIEIGQPYHFTLKVPILSPVVLGDYRSLHFDRPEAIVTSEEVEQELESLRERQATWHVVERPAAIGDRVTVDLLLTLEDRTISDLKQNPFELTNERHGLYTGMDEHIVGMEPPAEGEEPPTRTFTVTLPADYGNEKLAGKEANYSVTLYKVESKELPELDDAFAAQVSNFETLEELRKAISDSLLERKQRAIRQELQDKVVNAVIEQSQVTVHPLLVHDEAEHMLHQLSHVLEQQHMSLDQYLKLMRKTREEYIKELEPEAEQSVKRQLVLDEVAKEEKIEITPEDLESLARIYMQSGQNRTPTEEQMQTLAMNYRREKAITRLIELTTPPDVEAAEEPVVVQEQGNQEEEAGETAILDIQDQSDQAEETSGTPLLDTQNPSDQVQETLQTESENQAETEDRATTGNAPTSNVQ